MRTWKRMLALALSALTLSGLLPGVGTLITAFFMGPLIEFFNNMSGDEGAKHISELLTLLPHIESFRWSSTRTNEEGALVVGAETGKLTITQSSFESINWGEVSSGSRQAKFITIQTRGEKSQVINLYSQNVEVMELWYDGLRCFMQQPAATMTSRGKVDMFTKAVEQANILRVDMSEVEIPPLPYSLNYPPAPRSV